MRKVLALILLCPLMGMAQVNSVTSGPWTTPGTWSCNCVPDFTQGIIRISSTHTVTLSSQIEADDIFISGDGVLIIADNGLLILRDGTSIDLTQEASDPPDTNEDGVLIVEDGGILENRGQIDYITASLIIEDGAEYQHNQTETAIPVITWDPGSTCRVTGWGNSSANATFRASLGQTFHHFIWDSPGHVPANLQLLGSLTTVNGNLVINNTNSKVISFGLNGPTGATGGLNIGGNFIVTGTSKVSLSGAGTYNVDVGGNVEFSSTAADPNQYVINSTVGTTNLNIAGDLLLSSGQMNMAPSPSSGAILNVNIAGNLDLAGGSIIENGTGTATATVSFTGLSSATHQFIVGSGTFSGANVVLQNGSLSFSGNPPVIDGGLSTSTSTTLNLPATLSLTGNLGFNSGSTINNNGGTVNFTGSIAQTINTNGKTLNNVTINKAASNVTLSSRLYVTGAVNVVSANTILNSNSFLTLRSTSDAASGNASIGPLLNGAAVNGVVVVHRYMSSEDRIYRYISSPITNGTVGQLMDDFPVTGAFTQSSPCSGCSANPSLFYFDPAVNNYVGYPTTDSTAVLTPGRGYAAYVRQNLLPGPLTIDFGGPINQGGPITLPVVHNVTAAGWNLVGNPYPSSIDWDNAGWVKTNINATIAVRDNGEGLGGYRYWNGSVGSGVLGGLANGVIATAQGFWVQTNLAGAALTVTEDVKTGSTAPFYRKQDVPVNALSVTLHKDTYNDKTVFQIHEDAKLGKDLYDASKKVNDYFDFSIRMTDTTRYAINAVDVVPCETELYLDMRFTKKSGAYVINPQGSYSMTFNLIGTEFKKYDIFLRDHFTNQETPVTENLTYSFEVTADPASLSADRFRVVFGDVSKYPAASISVEEGNVLVANYEAGIEWLLNGVLLEGQTSKYLPATESGTYGLKVTIGNCTLSNKINHVITGVEEEQESLNAVFPNPFNRDIFVSLKRLFIEEAEISVVNSLGQEVMNGFFTNNADQGVAHLNSGHLADGFYFIRVKSKDNDRRVVFKAIKSTD